MTLPAPIITLTTDFGTAGPYVAAMKGIILGINPDVRLVDLSHDIPPQDVRHAAYFLAAAVPYFPAGVLHVVVVDPGVGSDRALLCVEWEGQRLLAPDNGCWTLLTRERAPTAVYRLEEPRYWRQPVSPTFHGRDILAPVAGHLSLGVPPHLLGPAAKEWVQLAEPAPSLGKNRLQGEVVFVDRFGNLITNIPGAACPLLTEGRMQVIVEEQEVPRCVRTYAEAEPGVLVALVSSSGRLEIAVRNGSAAQRLRAGVGTVVRVELRHHS